MADVSKKQIEDLGAKLEKFAQGLPKTERDVLGWVLQRASSGGGELSEKDLKQVSGGLTSVPLSGFERPTSALLSKSLSPTGKLGGDALAWRVSWSW